MRLKNGFTIMEMMVAIGIFASMVTVIVGIFVGSIRNQRTALVNQRIIGEVRYVTEHIGRSTMLARRDTEGDCVLDLLPGGEVGEKVYKADEGYLSFINQDGECVEYVLDGGIIYKNEVALTSSDFSVTDFNLSALNRREEGENDYRVTIMMRMESEGGEVEAQTTVSRR